MDVLDNWQTLVVDQCGLVTRTQLLAQGLTDDIIRAHVEAGRWQRVHGGVYATFTGPLLPEVRRLAAVLACWPCAVSHESAGEFWGMTRPVPGTPVHVTVRYGASAMRDDGLVVHRSRAFEHIVATSTQLPVVGMAHTAVDLAVAEPTARDGMRVMLHCLTVTKLRPAAVAAAIELRSPRRWRSALLDAIGLAQGGVTSKLESLYAVEVELAHGLPAAIRQFPVLVDGVVRYEDLTYRVGDQEVVVRLDGRRHHAEESVTITDRRRGNAAELAGRGHLSYGWPELTNDACRTAREVGAVLRRRGWTGALHPCERCWVQ